MTEIKEKPEITAAVSRMWDATATYQRGDLIPFAVLEEAAGVSRHDNQWGQRFKRWRTRMLEERSIALRAVPSVGYELLTDREQIDWCSKNRQKRIAKQVRRARREVSRADSSQLGVHYQQRQLGVMRHLEEQQRKAREGMWWIKDS